MAIGTDVTLWIAFVAGLLSFFSPCVMPLIPSYLTYISGLSFAQLNQPGGSSAIRWTVVFHSLVFISGFSAIFITLGGLAGFASSSFQAYLLDGLGIIQKIGGVLIFLFGIHLSGLFHFGLLLGEKRIQLRNKPAGFIGTFLVGIAFAAGWTPCIGPILGAILAIAAGSTGGISQGILLLTSYSAGLGVPFLISGLLFHSFLSFFDRFKKYIRIVEILTGVLLMVAGVLLFFDMFSRIATFLYQIFPPALG
ncbi:cytochrome c-type biogenesis protein [Desulfuromusa kysingii]|uniref:Cytochrome c-type biogenesis protein n=1 Tax=Desulfuromusa kysingii TaxID=37625 RepID=A0A1H4C2B9_9BACT|nr:cytochrome c biogenesis protein CcdA [Desulfuromusa kysingii]SEA54536.1 cytochrome c-type biogenesis protein [Desulfuromusa kysingii]